jgi:hypothetical protein
MEDGMKTLMMTVFALCVSACATSPADNVSSGGVTDWQIMDPATSPAAAVNDGNADAAPVQDAITPAASCSIVQFCNAPGSDGTRCLQQGCSLATAQAECSREAPAVCGTPVCPWIFVALDGTRFLNGSCL